MCGQTISFHNQGRVWLNGTEPSWLGCSSVYSLNMQGFDQWILSRPLSHSSSGLILQCAVTCSSAWQTSAVPVNTAHGSVLHLSSYILDLLGPAHAREDLSQMLHTSTLQREKTSQHCLLSDYKKRCLGWSTNVYPPPPDSTGQESGLNSTPFHESAHAYRN